MNSYMIRNTKKVISVKSDYRCDVDKFDKIRTEYCRELDALRAKYGYRFKECIKLQVIH